LRKKVKKEKDILIMGRELAGIVWTSTSEKYYLNKKITILFNPYSYNVSFSFICSGCSEKIK